MEHFICTGGCKTESKEEGVCEVGTCPHHDHALESCDCSDGKHMGKMNKSMNKDEGAGGSQKPADTKHPKDGE